MASSSTSGKAGNGLTLTVLGSGNLGTAILAGILSSLHDQPTSPSPDAPERLPSKFICCVRSDKSAARLKATFAAYPDSVSVAVNDNVAAVGAADVVILGCKPYMLKDVLSVPGMYEALAGKLLISILAGVPVPQIEEAVFGSRPVDHRYCTITRTLPNTAAGVRSSMTVIATSTPAVSPADAKLVEWIFAQVGEVVTLPAHLMDVAASLCGSGPAFFALVLEGAIDGALAMGVPRAEAQKMAAQTMRGAAEMVLHGEHPALLKEKVTTPGGCTIGGLLVMEEQAVRGSMARAVREGTVVASQLGKGVQGVNGTRFFPN